MHVSFNTQKHDERGVHHKIMLKNIQMNSVPLICLRDLYHIYLEHIYTRIIYIAKNWSAPIFLSVS